MSPPATDIQARAESCVAPQNNEGLVLLTRSRPQLDRATDQEQLNKHLSCLATVKCNCQSEKFRHFITLLTPEWQEFNDRHV